MRHPFALAATAWLIAASASAAEQAGPASREASIPFINHQGILDWRAADPTTLYIQARDRKWYRATLLDSCRNLTFATRIGFDTGPSNLFDRFSYILVEGQHCPLQSLVESGPPPKSAK